MYKLLFYTSVLVLLRMLTHEKTMLIPAFLFSGYYCDPHVQGSIAVEPSSHLKGNCMPINGTATGPQIAVEGGR